MRIFVFACSGLLVIAAGFASLSSEYPPTIFFERILSQPLPQKIAWLAILVAAPMLIVSALWQGVKLAQQRKVTKVLEARVRGTREAIEGLDRSQRDAELAASYLTHSNPEDAIKSLQQRLTKTEQAAKLQQGRDLADHVMLRIEDFRKQQQGFSELLSEAIDKRRLIEQALAELQTSQSEIDRMLLQIEGDGNDLQDRLQMLADSMKEAHPRFDEIERSMEMLIQLKRGLGALQARLASLEQNEHGGIRHLIKAVHEIRNQLIANVDHLEWEGELSLAQRIANIVETRQQLEERVVDLLGQFSKLDRVRKDISGLLAKLSNGINTTAV